MRLTAVAVAILATLCFTSPARAFNIWIDNTATAGVTTFSWAKSFDSQMGLNVIDLYETWTSNNATFVVIQDMGFRQDWFVRKHVLNSTGEDWIAFNNELLDQAGDVNDSKDGTSGYPPPAGWSPSNNFDGLSFSQSQNIGRTSNQFADCVVNEDVGRDFLEFTDGLVRAFGATPDRSDLMTFGLRDNGLSGTREPNNPFILAQRTVESGLPPIPEPATLFLVGAGLAAMAGARKRRRRS